MAAPPVKPRMSTLGRTQSVRTPGTTPTADSGRWPYGPTPISSNTQQTPGTPRGVNSISSSASASLSVKTRLGQMSLDNINAQSTFDKYATMPRRRRERPSIGVGSNNPSQESSTRSSSISRDRIMSSTTRLSVAGTNGGSVRGRDGSVTSCSTPTTPKMRSVVRRVTQKVKIFQETSSQTAMTGEDLDGGVRVVDVKQREKRAVGIQAEGRQPVEMEELKRELQKKSILLAGVEQQLAREREDKLVLQRELQGTTERVAAILAIHEGSDGGMMGESTDSLLMLESRVTSDSREVREQRQEIRKWRNLCVALKQELEEVVEREKKMLAEKESEEMQEFLRMEKAVLTDAAKEEEKAKWASVVAKKDQEIKWLLEECRHLVRFCEQRR